MKLVLSVVNFLAGKEKHPSCTLSDGFFGYSEKNRVEAKEGGVGMPAHGSPGKGDGSSD